MVVRSGRSRRRRCSGQGFVVTERAVDADERQAAAEGKRNARGQRNFNIRPHASAEDVGVEFPPTGEGGRAQAGGGAAGGDDDHL